MRTVLKLALLRVLLEKGLFRDFERGGIKVVIGWKWNTAFEEMVKKFGTSSVEPKEQWIRAGPMT